MLSNSYKILKKIFQDHMKIRPDMRVLDVGCGWRGNFLALEPDSYYGIDSNLNLIERLQRSKTGAYSLMDAAALDFENEYFDYVMSVSLLHHLSCAELKKAVFEIKRVLKKEGKVIFADGVYPRSKLNFAGWLIRFFDRGRYVRGKEELSELLLEYFNIDKEYYFVDKIFAYSLFVMSFKK